MGIIWRNFVVDSPIELTDLPLEKISENIGKSLMTLITLVEKNEVGESYRALSSIIDELYTSIIESK